MHARYVRVLACARRVTSSRCVSSSNSPPNPAPPHHTHTHTCTQHSALPRLSLPLCLCACLTSCSLSAPLRLLSFTHTHTPSPPSSLSLSPPALPPLPQVCLQDYDEEAIEQSKALHVQLQDLDSLSYIPEELQQGAKRGREVARHLKSRKRTRARSFSNAPADGAGAPKGMRQQSLNMSEIDRLEKREAARAQREEKLGGGQDARAQAARAAQDALRQQSGAAAGDDEELEGDGDYAIDYYADDDSADDGEGSADEGGTM